MSSSTKLSPRQPTQQEKTIIDEVLSLYQLKPTHQSYAHYSPNAVFHDPVSIAKGLDEIKSQFNGMPKLFSESVTKKYDVLEDPSNPDAIVMDLDQHYVFKEAMGKQPDKLVNSKITLKLKDGLIEQHIEEWDHQPNKTGNDGFMGKIQEFRKNVSAKIVGKTVPSDPDKI